MAASTEKLKVVLFIGSVRENRLGSRVAKFVQKALQNKNFDVDVFDPEVIVLPLLKKPMFHYEDPVKAPQALIEADKRLKAADAFVVVSAEYNHCIPPALTNLMSHFGSKSYSYKPSGIVTYSIGPYGGMRAAMQLRVLLGELGCISVSNILGIGTAQNQLNEAGEPQNESLPKSADRLIGQLQWHAEAMKNHRTKVGVPT